jgi:uncharacterized membrane protein YgcG
VTGKGEVYLVGAGPGDEELITVKGLRLIRTAEVLIFDALVSRALIEEADAAALRIDVGKRGRDHKFEQDGINSARRLVGAKEYTSQDMTIPMLFSSLVGLVATTGIPKTFLQTPPPMSGVPQANADAERRRRDEEERQRRRRREEEEEEQRRRRDDDFNSFGGGGLGSFGGGGSDFGGGFDIGGGGDFGGGGADGGW